MKKMMQSLLVLFMVVTTITFQPYLLKAEMILDENHLINTETNKNQVTILNYTSQCTPDMEGSGLGQAQACLDYNQYTYWHSEWGEDANRILPQHISFDLGKAYYMHGIKFLPRQLGGTINGDIFEVNIYVSEDPIFEINELVGVYRYDHNETNLNSRDFHDAIFENESYGRYVKFQAMKSGSFEGANMYATLAEIRFYGSEQSSKPLIIKDQLFAKIQEAQAIDRELYTEDSILLLQNVLNAAIAVYDDQNALQSSVDEVCDALAQAILMLEIKVEKVQKELLKQLIDEVENMDLNSYMQSSIDVLMQALTSAQQVYADNYASQIQVDLAYDTLFDAIQQLDEKVEIKPEMNFEDVQDKNAWFYGSIEKAFEKGLMNATGKKDVNKPEAKFFEPDANITRGMVATVLYRMASMPNVTYSAKFPDVANNLWYTNAIEWAAANGVVSGYKDGSFGPDDFITRQDLAIMLRNYAKKSGLSTNANVNFDAFKDAQSVDRYAASAVAWCVDAKLMSGANKADGKYLNPKANATRAECAKMFALLDDALKNK